jgi:hypothetical protein
VDGVRPLAACAKTNVRAPWSPGIQGRSDYQGRPKGFVSHALRIIQSYTHRVCNETSQLIASLVLRSGFLTCFFFSYRLVDHVRVISPLSYNTIVVQVSGQYLFLSLSTCMACTYAAPGFRTAYETRLTLHLGICFLKRSFIKQLYHLCSSSTQRNDLHQNPTDKTSSKHNRDEGQDRGHR